MSIRSFALLAIVASTPTSYARPGKTCAAVCQRLSDCKLQQMSNQLETER